MDQKILKIVEQTPLAQLGDLFALLVRKVTEHRRDNKDFLPQEIFASCVGIGGRYVCLEVIPVVELKNNLFAGYALKLRKEEGEQGWLGQYQIPGVSFTSTPEAAFERLSKEIYGRANPPALNQSNLEFLGVVIHHEPERNADCFTLVWSHKLETTLNELPGKWEVFSNLDDNKIIEHHRKTLDWVNTSKALRPVFVDLRK